MKLFNYIKKFLKILLATFFIGTGVGIIIYANVGSDTITVFQDGIHNVLNISYGQASRLYNCIMIIIACIFARKYFGIGTIISALLTGFAIDISNNYLVSLNIYLDLINSIFLFIFGHSSYTFGLSLLIKCNLGMNSLDSLLYKINEVTDIDYRISRFVVDLFLTLIGYVLGGVTGIGTIFSIITTGSFINCFTKILSKIERRETVNEN